MKEARERGSGAVRREWEPRVIKARYLGQHARKGAMIGITTDGIVCGRLGRRLSEAERWDQTGLAGSHRSTVGSSTDGHASARGRC